MPYQIHTVSIFHNDYRSKLLSFLFPPIYFSKTLVIDPAFKNNTRTNCINSSINYWIRKMIMQLRNNKLRRNGNSLLRRS